MQKKKDFVNVKNSDGTKDGTNGKIGFSKFAELLSKWCRTVG